MMATTKQGGAYSRPEGPLAGRQEQREERPMQEAEQPQPAAEQPLLRGEIVKHFDNFDRQAKAFAAKLLQCPARSIVRSLVESEAMSQLRNLITADMLQRVRALEGTQLGYGVDRGLPQHKNKEKYDDETVRTCLVVAMLSDFRWTGREFMIMHGQMFPLKAGWRRKLEEVEGISDIRCSPGAPYSEGGRIKVRVGLSWRLNGQPNMLTDGKRQPGMVFVVAGDTGEQLVGKAEARAYRAAYLMVTGSAQTEAVDYDDGVQQDRADEDALRATKEQQARIMTLTNQLGIRDDAWDAKLREWGVEDLAQLPAAGADRVIKDLEKKCQKQLPNGGPQQAAGQQAG